MQPLLVIQGALAAVCGAFEAGVHLNYVEANTLLRTHFVSGDLWILFILPAEE